MDKTMNKQELVAAVADETELSRAKAAEAVDAVLAAIGRALRDQMEVRLVGFGTFQTARRKATKGRNPRTGAAIDVPESTTIRFRPGKALKDAVGDRDG